MQTRAAAIFIAETKALANLLNSIMKLDWYKLSS